MQIYANGYIDPHDQPRLLTSLETVHTDMITRITQFKAQTSHWVHNQATGGVADRLPNHCAFVSCWILSPV